MTEGTGPAKDIEDLRGARLTGDTRHELLATQTECTFCFTDADGAPAAVVLSFVWDTDRYWFTSVAGRVHVRAVERDPRVCVTISGTGTALAGRRMLSEQGRATIHHDPAALADKLELLAARLAPGNVDGFLRLLRSPRRLLIEVIPEKVVASHDSRRLPGDGRGGPGSAH